jgi:polyisoprenyl-phosphate glycosyltransferase
MGRPTLSFVIPIYNEQAVIPELSSRLESALGSWSDLVQTWEVVFVDDGSSDASLSMLKELAARDPRYRVVSLSRNFGHQLAITAGLDRARGEAVVVMDADLQDPPELVRDMLVRWREGYDVVYAVRMRRHGEKAFKRIASAAFYRLLRAMLGGISIPVDVGDFRLMSRPVVLALRSLGERHRFVRGMVAWIGFRQTAVMHERPGRYAGETKYPFRKLLRLALDGITSFSTVPLRFATWLGVSSGVVAVLTALWAAYARIFTKGVIQGWTTLMIAVALAASAQLIMIGILGEYIGRIYEEVKRRPLYVVSEDVDADDEVRAR